jgi:alpha-beta hydrolase superfamily lysophospholipase
MKPRTKRFLLGTLALLAAGVVIAMAGAWVVGSKLLAAANRPVQVADRYRGTEVNFPSTSGTTLRGNFLKGEPGKGAIILMHGVRGNRGDMFGHADFLRARGFSVLLFDFQAHGESPGKIITNGYLESRDAAAAVDFIRAQLPGEKIGVLGSSLGGAAAVLAEPPLKVDAMVLEMVYPDLQRAAKNRIAKILGKWARPLSPLLTLQASWRIGKDPDWFSPIHAITNVTCPKLIIAGALDRLTTLDDSKALFAAANKPKDMIIISAAGHENLHEAAGKAYEDQVRPFFEQFLRKGSSLPIRAVVR